MFPLGGTPFSVRCREFAAAVCLGNREGDKRVEGNAVEGEVALTDGDGTGRRTGTRRRIGMGTRRGTRTG